VDGEISIARGATSFEAILPFLRPIEGLIKDAAISGIIVNGPACVFIERDGRSSKCQASRSVRSRFGQSARNIARALGDEISEERPLLDSRLPDGSRVAAVIPPFSIGGTTLTIRKFHSRFFTAEELERAGSLSRDLLGCIRAAVEHPRNILISGGTSTGKMTFLTALTAFISDRDCVVLIEDAAEICWPSRTSSAKRANNPASQQ
jgi:pilus assembly protein CpaF